ncbi:biotin synthase BioB [Eubacterium sp.]|uniref:biotin synthase BioB n=1 Tax=Eubacterium sp. TaxID=142586 RepID=UPI0025D9A9AB|nr:biotin synthase BioB [Eubacterium sp.]MCR5629139.1 biotin synthase BioB [Eubacterium sp.]
MKKLKEEIINGKRLNREDDLNFFKTVDLKELCKSANDLKNHFCGNYVDFCTIINGRSGKCSEDCKFCAQSIHHKTNIETYDFLDKERILKECKHNDSQGVDRFAIVTAGKKLSGNEFNKAIDCYKTLMKETNVKLCASFGLLDDDQFKTLVEAGVKRYHSNIETSRNNFKNICSTHTFEDRINCIRRAKAAGLEVCSGGIIGIGENMDDRIDMALTLAEEGINSVPINALIPIPGTPLENLERITEDEILRTIAMFRFILPEADIRLAAGRNLMSNCGETAFISGANAAITGDMLTTSGNGISDDINMINELGLSSRRKKNE